MHWFWRAAIAAVVPGTLYVGVWVLINGLPTVGMGSRDLSLLIVAFFFIAACGTATLGSYTFLTRWFGPPRVEDKELRCRKCDYILRGITEPRCPECGETI